MSPTPNSMPGVSWMERSARDQRRRDEYAASKPKVTESKEYQRALRKARG